MSFENDTSSSSTEVDNKVVKKHFPRTNNDSVLEIVLERDPNLALRKNSIAISFTVDIDDRLIIWITYYVILNIYI